MKETDFRKQNASLVQEYELTQDELERLIEEKFKRARVYQQAFDSRDKEVVDFD